MGLALNWEMISCTVMEAVWNSNGAKVTVISTSLLAGTIPVHHRFQSEFVAHMCIMHTSQLQKKKKKIYSIIYVTHKTM